MIVTRFVHLNFREGDEVVLAKGTHQGTLGSFYTCGKTSTGRISPSVMVASATLYGPVN